MSSDSLQSGQFASKTFEFTKRKRWADLLVCEIADAINIILSASGTILYCSPAITEITGLKDAELLDRDLSELIANTEDQVIFRASFDESVQKTTHLHSFVRFKCSENLMSHSSTPKDILFEIEGYPLPTEKDGMLFFATAKPYPSRNTEMLNTFLNLKIENDQLQYRRTELTKKLPPKVASPLMVIPSQIYATSPINVIPAPAPETSVDASIPYYSSGHGNLAAFDGLLEPSLERAVYEASNYVSAIQTTPPEDESEEGSKRKKPKKVHSVEQHVCVTCGRTNSPEWRKGPLGPKTLCNACGLRWAKQARTEKSDDPILVC